MAAGVIYILVTPTNRKLLKIGKTTRTAEERAVEISDGTGVPAPFWVIYEEEVQDCDKAERVIHSHLASYRYQRNREFFELPLRDAIFIVMNIIEQVNAESSNAGVKTRTVGPVIGKVENMTQILGPSPISIKPRRGTAGKVYFQGEEIETTDKHLKWRNLTFDFRSITSVQVFEGKLTQGFFGGKRDYTLVVNTLKGGVGESQRIDGSDRGTIMEVFRLLTTAK
jgi:hypothetical protein